MSYRSVPNFGVDMAAIFPLSCFKASSIMLAASQLAILDLIYNELIKMNINKLYFY